MATFEVRYAATININVKVTAEDEDEAQTLAWDEAQEYLCTVTGDHRNVTADVSLDGVGADEVEEV